MARMANENTGKKDGMITSLTFDANKVMADEELIALANELGTLRVKEMQPKIAARLEIVPAFKAAIARIKRERQAQPAGAQS